MMPQRLRFSSRLCLLLLAASIYFASGTKATPSPADTPQATGEMEHSRQKSPHHPPARGPASKGKISARPSLTKRLIGALILDLCAGFLTVQGIKFAMPISLTLYFVSLPLYALGSLYLLGPLWGTLCTFVYFLVYPILRYRAFRSQNATDSTDRLAAALSQVSSAVPLDPPTPPQAEAKAVGDSFV